MKTQERGISSKSEVFFYTPSATAANTFFYPLCTGHFYYKPGYSKYRNSYDSFLLMYIISGELEVEFENKKQTVSSHQFVLLDCYAPHGYSSESGWESLWIHFDGPMARAYYNLITEHLGNCFSIKDTYTILNNLQQIYDTFEGGVPVKEPLISKQLTDILTGMLLYTPGHGSIEEIVRYINENFREDLTIDFLAKQANLSSYHFIRIFKKETGFTPHEYIRNTRISTAKYLLKNTDMSIKDICYHTGFSCESVFCSAFKKHIGVTPTDYRSNAF